MKRKVSTLPTRNWAFGALPPTENKKLFDDQLHAAHVYYNQLIEIERARREEYRKARSAFMDETLEARYVAFCNEIEKLRVSLKAERAEKRTRQPASLEIRNKLKALAEDRKTVYAIVKAARLRLKEDPELQAAASAIAERASAKVREARGACGVYWGSYLLVEKAAEAARRSSTDPEFRRWKGEGRVGVQLHHEKFSDVVEGRSTMLRIALDPQGEPTSHRQKKRRFATVSIRAGSEGRAPVWVSFPVRLHRMPPPDATLTWAWVQAHRIGTDVRYELVLALESASFGTGPRGKGVAAVDAGWRVLPDGDLRVAYLRDDTGHERELRLPAKLIGSLRFADELRGHQDRHFDTARAAFGRYLSAYAEELPEWLAEVKQTLHLWKSPAKLAKTVGRLIEERGEREAVDGLWQLWRAERLAAREDLFAPFDEVADFVGHHSDLSPTVVYLELWRRKNRHLHNWEAHVRQRVYGCRADIYKKFAYELATTYDTVIFEDMDHRDLARNAKPEEATTDYLHWMRNLSAPGELRTLCKTRLGADHFFEEVTKDSTRECDICHHVNDWPDVARRAIVLTCNGCGAAWDQDANAAKVLLRRYFERFGRGQDPAGARESTKPAAASSPEAPKASTRKPARRTRSQTTPQPGETVVP